METNAVVMARSASECLWARATGLAKGNNALRLGGDRKICPMASSIQGKPNDSPFV